MKVNQPIVTKVNKVLAGRAHICGGAILSCFQGELPNDIDIFMKDPEDYLQVCADLYNSFMKPNSVDEWMSVIEQNHEEANYWAYEFAYEGTVISVIIPQEMFGRNTYGDIESIVNEIDISVCRMGLKSDDTIYFADSPNDTIGQIVNWLFKVVMVRPEEEAERTAKRVEKYKDKGYRLIDEIKPEDFVAPETDKQTKMRPATHEEIENAVEAHTGSNKKILKKIVKQKTRTKWKDVKKKEVK